MLRLTAVLVPLALIAYAIHTLWMVVALKVSF